MPTTPLRKVTRTKRRRNMVVANPYLDKTIGEYFERTFKSDVDDGELVWHRDHEDRYVQVVEGDGWQLQIDNQIPTALVTGKEYFIPKNTFHRILKGNSNLVVNIKEIK